MANFDQIMAIHTIMKDPTKGMTDAKKELLKKNLDEGKDEEFAESALDFSFSRLQAVLPIKDNEVQEVKEFLSPLMTQLVPLLKQVARGHRSTRQSADGCSNVEPPEADA